jgi:hypothetical protein
MVFSPNSPKVDILIDNEILQEVVKTKFLGVVLDKHLTWKFHIQHVTSKISKCIGIMYKARRVLNRDSMISLYNTFYPYLTYCVQIWGSTCTSALHAKKRTAPTPLFKSLNVLPFPQLYKYEIVLFMFKYNMKLLPDAFDGYFTSNNMIHSYNTHQCKQIQVLMFKTKHGQLSFYYQAVALWKSIGYEIMKASNEHCNICVFQAALKKQLALL